MDNISRKELVASGFEPISWEWHQQFGSRSAETFPKLVGKLLQTIEMLPLNEVQLSATKKTVKDIMYAFREEEFEWIYGRIPKENLPKIEEVI